MKTFFNNFPAYIKRRHKKDIKYICLFLAGCAALTAVLSVPQSDVSYTNGSEDDSVITVIAKEDSNENKSAESLKFEQVSYSVVVGKSVTAKVKYTQDNKNNGDVYEENTDKSKVSDKNEELPKITWTVNNPDIAEVDENGNITGKSTGQTGIYASLSTGVSANCFVQVVAPDNFIIEDVPFITQNLYYPSGCESVSATMLLQYYDYDITPDEFIDSYLPQGYFITDNEGKLTGPDLESVFIGSPYSEDSLGCMPPVIVYSINQALKDKDKQAIDLTGSSLQSLLDNYVANGDPVLVWATMNMWTPVITYQWEVTNPADYSSYKEGDICSFYANEHCLVLVGYDEDYYYFNDPLSYSALTVYDKETFEDRYRAMGRGAVAVVDK